MVFILGIIIVPNGIVESVCMKNSNVFVISVMIGVIKGNNKFNMMAGYKINVIIGMNIMFHIMDRIFIS